MKAILRLALIVSTAILIAVLATLTFVKWRQASELGHGLDKAVTQIKGLRGEIRSLKEEIDTLEEKLREAAASLAAQSARTDAPPSKKACSAGAAPRSIDSADASRYPLELRYKPGVLKLINDGQSLTLAAAAGSSLKLGPEIFELISVHFLRPEGGQVDGKPVALVAHLTHRTAGGQTVVVSVPIRESAFQHRTIWQIWNHIPAKGAPEATISNVSIDPMNLLPDNLSYQVYEGALTIPPCAEKARFYQLRNPIGISKDQLEKFLARVKAPAV